MLSKSKWFKLTTYPKNEDEIRSIFESFDVAIEDEWGTVIIRQSYPTFEEPTRITFECHVSFEKFDKLVAYLENDFKSWARMSY